MGRCDLSRSLDGHRPRHGLRLGRAAVAAALLLHTAAASADEVCRFTGTTDYAGRLTATADARISGGATRIDVQVRFDAQSLLFAHIHYLIEEISTVRSGELQQLAVNSRYSIAGHVVRQQWDVFDRAADGLQAYRVQGKRLADFRRHHARFLDYWDMAAFGRPWLDHYPDAAPERRPDLDLHETLPPGLRAPLALAFYWVRWLPPGGATVPVFLPGFKTDKQVDLTIGPAGPPGPEGQQWRAPLHYPALSRTQPSEATATISADRHVSQISFDLHGPVRSANGLIHGEGCTGSSTAR